MLNLLSGNKPKEGFVNLDGQRLPGVDVRCWVDPFRPRLPFRDDAFEAIWADNAVEHFADTNRLIQEMWRVSADGARWYILTPSYRGENSWNDPTHFSHWGPHILDFYLPEGFDGRRYPPATLTFDRHDTPGDGLEFLVTAHKPGVP